MDKSFTLRWKNPATDYTFSTNYIYDVTGRGKGQTFRQYVARCIRVGEREGLEFVGEVRGSQIRCPLSKSGLLLLARSPDKTQALLQNGEGKHEVWAKRDDFAGYVVTIRGQGYEFVTSLKSVDATKLARRWHGISPNEDDDLDVGGAVHEREVFKTDPAVIIPAELYPTEETLMAHFAEKTGVELSDENRELFRQMAQSRLRAMSTAAVIPVPEMHDEAQEVEVVRFDPESGEYTVTQDYHDLYAAEGEVVTRKMSDRDHGEMAQIIRNLAVMGCDTSASLAVATKAVFAGQIFDWDDVQQRATAPSIELTDLALTIITEVCFVMAEEQANRRPANVLGLPEIHIAPNASFTICGSPVKAKDAGPKMRGDLPFIHPKRFLQVGPVPFGPMCGECVEGLRQLESKRGPLLVVEDDELLELLRREGHSNPVLGEISDSLREQMGWADYDTSDPVYDLVMTHETPGWTEASVRGILSAFREKGLIRKTADITAEAKRVYSKWVAAQNVSKAQANDGQIDQPGAPFPFYSCGGCEHYHPLGWAGECRDDSQRFTAADLDERYGEEGWAEVDELSGEPNPDATEGADYQALNTNSEEAVNETNQVDEGRGGGQ